MGSFNVGCGLTNMSIGAGDKVGLLLLAKPIYDNSGIRSNSNTTSYIRCTDVFAPYLPPIYGEYDDYGLIENIEPSVTTELLEEMFTAPISSIIAAIRDTGSPYYGDSTIAQMYMPEEMKHLFGYSSNEKEQMEALGFTHSVAENGNILFENKQFLITGATENGLPYRKWNLTHKKKNITTQDTHDLKIVLNLINKTIKGYLGYPLDTWNKIDLLNELGGMMFLREAKEKLVPLAYKHVDYWYKPLEEMNADVAKLLTKLSQVKYSNDQEFELLMLSSEWHNLVGRETTSFPSDKMGVFGAYAANPEEFLEMNDLVTTMSKLNRLFMPTFSGEQFGDEKFELAALEVSKEILDVKVKQAEADRALYGDDDDE
jgi:hypothetical protein